MNSEQQLLSVLIVDDEPFIRKGLRALIDWEAEGFVIKDEAENGQEALFKIKSGEFDLVITDIMMPVMNGIDLIKAVKEDLNPKMHFIILSGFYEYQYTRYAIQYGCSDYILKPIQKDELVHTLRRVFDEISKQPSAEEEYEKAYLDRNVLAILRGKFDMDNITLAKEKLLLSDHIAYAHFELNSDREKFNQLSEEEKRNLQKRMYHVARIMLKKYSNHVIMDVINAENCYDVGLIYCDSMAKEANLSDQEWFKRFMSDLSERLEHEVTACYGILVNDLEHLSESYREAEMTRYFRMFGKNDETAAAGPVFAKKNLNKNGQEEYYKKEMDALIHAIDISDKTLICSCVKDIYYRFVIQCSDSDLIGLNVQYLLYRLLGLAYDQDSNINQEAVLQYMKDAAFTLNPNVGNELKFQQFALDYSDYLVQLRQNSVRGVIAKIENEIETNYAQNLSLKTLGEKYYVNSAYLGQVFRKQFDCSFKDYLNTVRTRKAAELLRTTDKKVYIIAEEVGYKNLDYFINKFESIYGKTPSVYRKGKTE